MELANTTNGTVRAQVPAQLDTAADRTLIPLSFAIKLNLEPIDRLLIGGVGGIEEMLQVFAVSLTIRGSSTHLLKVVAHPKEQWVLLGRDVLNAHRIILDGPHLVLELE